MQETEDIVTRLHRFADHYTTTDFHDAMIREAATTISTLRAEVDKLRAELKLCGKDNCMGRRVKGVTQWVTEQAKDAAVAAVRAEVEGLRAVLQRILDEPKQTMSDAKALREIVRMARAAIDAAKADKEGA